MISIKNNTKLHGIQMCSDVLSAYPSEQDVLLAEGLPVFVLEVEEITISNKDKSFEKYDGLSLTIIHLSHIAT